MEKYILGRDKERTHNKEQSVWQEGEDGEYLLS